MVVQAGAERRAVPQGSTHEVLETVEEIGRGALTEMRRLVGMLRSDADEGRVAAADRDRQRRHVDDERSPEPMGMHLVWTRTTSR